MDPFRTYNKGTYDGRDQKKEFFLLFKNFSPAPKLICNPFFIEGYMIREIADSLLRASARKGQSKTTPIVLAEKTKGPRLRMAAGISAGKAIVIDGQEANAYGANGKKAGRRRLQ